MTIRVQKLSKNQIQDYLDILLERAKWLEGINQPMWNTDNLTPKNFEKKYPDNTPYLIYIEEQIVGGFILVENDPFLWNESENSQSAYYIHKLVIKPEFSGLGYAQKSISLIEEMARQAGVSYLRLDCYEDRTYLMNLYERCGFNKKRRTVMPDGIVLVSYEMALKPN